MITFRPASKGQAKPLIGLYAESGCGKTYSALLLAKGFAGDMGKVAMIETESGRGEAYAAEPDVGGYLVHSIRDEFSPTAYGQAILAAGQSGLSALIIDSASHEWEGPGGVLSMAADNQASGKIGPLVWQKPKMDHQREFMLRLLGTSVPLVIVCMRAKYPMEEIVNAKGKREWQRSTALAPKQSEDILFEMFCHGWIDRDHAFHGTKYTLNELRDIFRDGEPISVDTGRRLATWAAGVKPPRSELAQKFGRDVAAATSRESVQAAIEAIQARIEDLTADEQADLRNAAKAALQKIRTSAPPADKLSALLARAESARDEETAFLLLDEARSVAAEAPEMQQKFFEAAERIRERFAVTK